MSGIDVYTWWPGQQPVERAAQLVSTNEFDGHLGALHEEYVGSPYATRYLVTEAFLDDSVCECPPEMKQRSLVYSGELLIDARMMETRCDACKGVPIPGDVLRERLPETIRLAIQRQWKLYKKAVPNDHPAIQSYNDFVDLCIRKEEETGQPVRVYASY